MRLPQTGGILSGLRNIRHSVLDDEDALRFLCDTRLRKRKITAAVIWVTFAVIVALAILLSHLGMI